MATWVLLHGTPLTPRVWEPTAQELTDQPVVIPDLTEVAFGARPQEQLARRVLADLDGAQLDVIGHSFGGQVGIELALAAPERVRSLTILCSRDTPFPAFAPVAEHLRAGVAPPVQATLGRWFTADELHHDRAAVGQVRSDLSAATLSSWAAAVDAIARYDRAGSRGGLSMPVHLVAARHDGVSTPDVMAELAADLPRSSFECVDEWSHMSPFVDPRALAVRLVAGRDAAIGAS